LTARVTLTQDFGRVLYTKGEPFVAEFVDKCEPFGRYAFYGEWVGNDVLGQDTGKVRLTELLPKVDGTHFTTTTAMNNLVREVLLDPYAQLLPVACPIRVNLCAECDRPAPNDYLCQTCRSY
jgi:hypothetical protein